MELTRIYKLIPYLLIVLALGAIAFLLITGNTALLIKSPIFILLVFIIGSLFIILTKKHHSESTNINKIANLNLPQRTLRRIFVITGALMMITILLGLKDSVIYIALLVILVVCIILQILSKNVSAPWVIGELLYVVAMLVFPFTFAYEYYYGGTDIFEHVYLTDMIIQSSHLDSFSSTGSTYSNFPATQISTAITSLLTAFQTNVSLYVFMILSFLVLSIFIYLIAKQFFPSTTIGLLAIFIVLIPAIATKDLATFAPYSFLASLSFMVFYLIFRKNNTNKIHYLILSIPIILCCIIAHHANQLPLIGIIFFFAFTDLVIIPLCTKHKVKNTHSINISVVLLYLLASVGYIYYMYITRTLGYLTAIFSIFENKDLAVSTISKAATNIDVSDVISSVLQSSNTWLCLIPALIGMYILITSNKTSRRQYLIGFFMLIFFIFISGVASVIPALNSMMLERFDVIIFTLFSGGVAFGLCWIIVSFQTKKGKKYLGQVLICIFCISLLITPCITFNSENTILKDTIFVKNGYPSYHISTGEMSMTNTISEIIPAGSIITTDREFARYFKLIGYSSAISTENTFGSFFRGNKTSEPELYQKYPYILLRMEHLLKYNLPGDYTRTIKGNMNSVSTTPISPTSESVYFFGKNTYRYNTIYENGGSNIYAI